MLNTCISLSLEILICPPSSSDFKKNPFQVKPKLAFSSISEIRYAFHSSTTEPLIPYKPNWSNLTNLL